MANMYLRCMLGGFILALLLMAASPTGFHEDGVVAREGTNGSELHDFKIERPNFVVTGANLGNVEVWLWSTGTGITKPALIGTAKRITNEGEREKWVLGIPPNLLAVEIFASAFDKAGNVVGKKSLPYKDPGALYEAMYGKK